MIFSKQNLLKLVLEILSKRYEKTVGESIKSNDEKIQKTTKKEKAKSRRTNRESTERSREKAKLKGVTTLLPNVEEIGDIKFLEVEIDGIKKRSVCVYVKSVDPRMRQSRRRRSLRRQGNRLAPAIGGGVFVRFPGDSGSVDRRFEADET